MKKNKTDVLIIGAGPAGTIAASLIHKAGFEVRVVERLKFPRFVIGESLLPRCMEVLQEAELLEAIAAKNFQQKTGAKFRRGDEVADYRFADQFTAGWQWTWQVPRAEFDQALALETMRKGVHIDFETTVTDIRFNEGSPSIVHVEHKDKSKEEIAAQFIIDASGYGRVIPKLLNFENRSSLDPRRAVFAHVKDVNREEFDEPNRITIVVYQPGVWSWIIPFSNGTTSVGFVGGHDFFSRYPADPTAQFNALVQGLPFLQKRFRDASFVFEPRVLESWSSASDKFYGKGYVLTGNVTEFLDPIFSSGVMFAAVSSHLASTLVIRELKGEQIDWEKEYTGKLQQGVETFRTFVNLWYDGTLEKVFFAKNPDPLIKKQVCSVLAGYVWDLENPFVKEPEVALRRLVKYIDAGERFDLTR